MNVFDQPVRIEETAKRSAAAISIFLSFLGVIDALSEGDWESAAEGFVVTMFCAYWFRRKIRLREAATTKRAEMEQELDLESLRETLRREFRAAP